MSMERSGGPTLRPKLERAQQSGPSPGQLIKVSALAAGAVAVLGVVVAAAVPSIDLFGIYAGRESTATATPKAATPSASAPATPNAPAAPAPAPIFDPNSKAAWESPDEADLPRPSGVTPEPDGPDVQPDRPPVVRPRPTKPERSVERDMALLGDLRPAAALPPINEIGDATLAYLHEAEQISFDDVQLVADLAALGDDQAFHFERDGKQPRWTIRFTGPPALDSPASGAAEGDELAAGFRGNGRVGFVEGDVAEGGDVETGGDGDAVDGDAGESGDADADAPPDAATACAQPAKVDVVIAEVWCVASSVMFRWRDEAQTIPAAEQLRNAVVRFTVGSRKQSMALREPVAKPIYTLDLEEPTSEVAATIEHPPQAASLYLEVLGAGEMPVNAYYADERKSIALPTVVSAKPNGKLPRGARPKPTPNRRKPVETTDDRDAEKRVTILFDKFVDGVQPQLWVDGEYDGAGDVTLRFAPRIVRDKVVAELTSKSLETYRQPRQQRMASCERDWKNAHDAMVLLDRRMGEVRAGINPTVSVRALQAQFASAQRAYKKLDDELNQLRADLAWMNAADLLIKSIDKHGQLKYRVFAKSGDLEVDLVRGGLQ